MEIFTGRVVGGRVELPPDAFPEGSEVTVLAQDREGPFSLTPEQEAELRESFEQVRRGEFVEAEDLLEELRSQVRR